MANTWFSFDSLLPVKRLTIFSLCTFWSTLFFPICDNSFQSVASLTSRCLQMYTCLSAYRPLSVSIWNEVALESRLFTIIFFFHFFLYKNGGFNISLTYRSCSAKPSRFFSTLDTRDSCLTKSLAGLISFEKAATHFFNS